MAILYKCPFCYNTYTLDEEGNTLSNLFEHDPITTKSGTKYTLESTDGGVTWNWINHEGEEDYIPNFKKLARITNSYVIELQDKWDEMQTYYGIPTAQKIQFSTITPGDIVRFHKGHIQEIRDAIQLILNRAKVGWAGFFNYTNKWMGTYQTDWVDSDLTNYHGRIKNIHIEDARHHFGIIALPSITIDEDIASDSNVVTSPRNIDGWNWVNAGTWTNDLGYDEEEGVWKWGLQYHKAVGTVTDYYKTDTDHYTYSVPDSFKNQYPESSFSISKSAPNLNPPSDIIRYGRASSQERIFTEEYEGSGGTVTRGGVGGYKIEYYESETYPNDAYDGTKVGETTGDISEYQHTYPLIYSLVDSYTIYYGYDYAVMKLTGALDKELGVPKWG